MLNKILLVGGSGYLGQHLEYMFNKAGFKVHVTGTGSRNADNFHRISFEDEKSFTSLSGYRYDLMIVLASKLNALGTTQLSHPDLNTNVVSYANFLEYTAQQKIADRLIYISSMTVYGRQNKLPVEEEGTINPVNTYGLSKYMAEAASSFYCTNNNVKGVVFRLPGIYGGVRKSGYIYNISEKCLHNENIILSSNGLLYWETIHVDDLCNIILRFIHHYQWDTVFDIFNISYGEEVDFYKAAYLIKRLLKSKSHIIEAGSKEYIPFYLSNRKIKGIIQIKEDFETSLMKYLVSFG